MSPKVCDPELTSVRRPFDAAFLRMCQAKSVDLLRDELSNMLQHTYRLSELCRRRWKLNKNDHHGLNAKVARVPGALGAIWIRSFDTHEIAELSTTDDVYSDFYTELYGVAVWKPLEAMPFVHRPAERSAMLARYDDYRNLERMPVLDTMRPAFDGLASLL
jgi:hypothetical protein